MLFVCVDFDTCDKNLPIDRSNEGRPLEVICAEDGPYLSTEYGSRYIEHLWIDSEPQMGLK